MMIKEKAQPFQKIRALQSNTAIELESKTNNIIEEEEKNGYYVVSQSNAVSCMPVKSQSQENQQAKYGAVSSHTTIDCVFSITLLFQKKRE